MARNIILLVATLGGLVVLYLGYTWLVAAPEDVDDPNAIRTLDAPAATDAETISIGQDVTLPGGKRIVFRRYDERTGTPTDLLSVKDWQPVAGSDDQVRVTEPELSLRLPSGMIATVIANEGQLRGDRLQRGELRPRTGWLAGDVAIIVDRNTDPNRPPRDERPGDLITIRVARLEFDLQRGKLITSDRLTVESDDFDAAGEGLDLVWSQSENRVETMTIGRGDHFVFYAPAELLDTPREATGAGEPATGPTTAPTKPRPRETRPSTTYNAVLTGNVVAEQYRQGQIVGGMQADEVQLKFDVGGGAADRTLRPRTSTQPTTKSATRPAMRPERDPNNRFVVKWSGPLRLTPDENAAPSPRRRLQLVATGAPVVLTRRDGRLEAARVEYHDETQRAWVDPPRDQTLRMSLGKDLSAEAAGLYIDRVARLIKLVGPLDLRSRRATQGRTERSSIRSSQWAELKLGQTVRADPQVGVDELFDLDRLESARFVGEVHVNLDGQRLTAARLDVGFDEGAPDQSLESAIRSAVAFGDVRLSADDGRIACDNLTLAFDHTEARRVYPKHMDAYGNVRMERDRAKITGEHVVSDLAALPADAPPAGPAFVVRTVQITGAAELLDSKNKVAARGERIDASFEDINRLVAATVLGSRAKPAQVYSEPYGIWGERIDLSGAAQTLGVEGPSRLAFRSDRSLQGDRRGTPTAVTVTAQRRLEIDAPANRVLFEGDVVAISGEEALRAETMTLVLENARDEPADTQPAPRINIAYPWLAWLDEGRRLAGVSRDDPADTGQRFSLAGESGFVRKEPVRLLARSALMTSETFADDDPNTPVVHASLSAPELDVDIVNRRIVTRGLTQLLMIDRRPQTDDESAAAGDAIGLPSALVTRGRSQTAMQCVGQMTYTLGPDGPQRRDTVVFEDDVFFVHRAGSEMLNLRETLPQAAGNPKLLESENSRNTSLECERLECAFNADTTGAAARGGALTRTPLRLASLTASDKVYLRDQQAARIREVNADWIQFDRELSQVAVKSPGGGEARVVLQDTSKNTFDTHAGRELTINLKDGTIRSDQVSGEIRRP